MSVILGLWPIAGITTVGVTQADARATIAAAIESGITTFDTAFSYGYDGESDRLLGDFVRHERERFRVIGKVGQRWAGERKRIVDGSKSTLTADAETSLRRMGIEQFDLLMLHSPDPATPIEVSAAAVADLQRRGLCKQIGVCNVTVDQYRQFSAALDRESTRCAAIQCPLNLMQRGSLEELIPECHAEGCEVYAFWVLMKGLLAGRISRDHQFADGDVRPGYEIFQGRARRQTHQMLDAIAELAPSTGRTVAQLTIGWALSQAGVTAALVGARRPEQIIETAGARPLSPATLNAIEEIIAEKS